MKKQRKLSIALATMLAIQTIIVTGCTEDSDSVTNITTEITTESITQTETIQIESEKLEDNKENNTQIELPYTVQTINIDDYKPFDIQYDEFIESYNYFSKHFTEQTMEGYEQMSIEDENIDFYSYEQTKNCNVYVMHIGDKVEGLDIVVYCSPDDMNEILNIKIFTNLVHEDSNVNIELYGKIYARAIFSIICSVTRSIDYDSINEKPDLLNDFYEELKLWSDLSEEMENQNIKSYRDYIYTAKLNFENRNMEFDVVKE